MSPLTDGDRMFLAIMPKVLRKARFEFRGEDDWHTREDCIQEVVALCWLWCRRLAKNGKDACGFPYTLAAFACRHVRAGRSFVGKKRLTKDALSKLAWAMRGFLAQRLPDHMETYSSENPLRLALADNTQSEVPEQAAFRIDFPAWLSSFPKREQQIIEQMMQGEKTLALSQRFGLSPGRISQMRRQFMAHWRTFVGDA